jgi:hypothetical protein
VCVCVSALTARKVVVLATARATPSPSASTSLRARVQCVKAKLGPLLADVLQCYAAHRQLALCPYFPAACGAYNASLGVAAPADGTRFSLFYEHIHALSLGHLVRAHGSVAETQPLFRRVACDLLVALCGIEEQCTFALEARLCLDNVFLADGGVRLVLGRLPWGAEIREAAPDAPLRLRERAHVLAESFAHIMAALNGDGGAGRGGDDGGAPRAVSGVVDCVNARAGEEVRIALEAPPGRSWSAVLATPPVDAFGRPVLARVEVTSGAGDGSQGGGAGATAAAATATAIATASAAVAAAAAATAPAAARTLSFRACQVCTRSPRTVRLRVCVCGRTLCGFAPHAPWCP